MEHFFIPCDFQPGIANGVPFDAFIDDSGEQIFGSLGVEGEMIIDDEEILGTHQGLLIFEVLDDAVSAA